LLRSEERGTTDTGLKSDLLHQPGILGCHCLNSSWLGILLPLGDFSQNRSGKFEEVLKFLKYSRPGRV
jgi:hypothetical protein